MEEIYCFGGNPLDRASERRRDTLWIQSLLDDPSARILPLCELRPLIRGDAAPELDWQPGEFFDIAGVYLVCSTHGAIFEPNSGLCVAGPCRGA